MADFFQQFNAPLKTMPVQDRAELHTEMRQHLDALIAAHLELGASPVEALDAASSQRRGRFYWVHFSDFRLRRR